jgi:hypothetical protein
VASTDAPGYGVKVLINNKVMTNFSHANHTIDYHPRHEFYYGIKFKNRSAKQTAKQDISHLYF